MVALTLLAPETEKYPWSHPQKRSTCDVVALTLLARLANEARLAVALVAVDAVDALTVNARATVSHASRGTQKPTACSKYPIEESIGSGACHLPTCFKCRVQVRLQRVTGPAAR